MAVDLVQKHGDATSAIKHHKAGKRTQSNNLTRKQRGEMAEAAFVAKAVSLGLCVSKPWGESQRYDLIVDNGRRLLRVQVKSAHRPCEGNSYNIQARGNSGRVYDATEIDFLVAWIAPVNAWYVFPVEEFRSHSQMQLFPSSRKSKYDKFREAWHLVDLPSTRSQ